MSVLHKSAGHLVRQVQPGLWQIVFHLPATTNSWLVAESDGLALVDAGHPWNAQAILMAVQRIGAPLRRIFITHAHPDHCGAAAELARRTGAEVLAHEVEVPYLEGRGCMADERGFWLCRMMLNTGRHLRILNSPVVERVTPVGDGQQVGSLQILHTPGHTPGSISLWSEEHKGLFCGDNVVSSYNFLHLGVPWFTLDSKTRNDSLHRYSAFPARLLLTGHGPPYAAEDAVRDVLKLLKVCPA